MTFSYTCNFINGLKSNLSTSPPMIHGYELKGTDKKIYRKEQEIDSKYIFQILLYENHKFKLVYGKKKNIYETYGIDPLSLGVDVNEKFVSQEDIEYPTVFFLLKCRRLSQVIASTWLTSKLEDIKITLTKKILDSYNIFPPETYWLNDHGELKELKGQLQKYEDLLYCITPTHISYRAVSLALLFCGQAYYKDCDTWTKISEPIFTTYETIWEYGLDLSWDTYYSTRIDVSQAGGIPLPPFTSVVLGYPPKPSTFSLQDEQIEYWVDSPDEYEAGENKYPFYPKHGTIEWKQKDLLYIVPPFPYLPLSCM